LNLVVDFGNTRIKAALFLGGKIIFRKEYNTVMELTDDATFHGQSRNVIVASVTDSHETFIKALTSKKKIILFESHTPIPIKNNYESASTLGSDRLAASIGSFSIYPGQNVLTIDAGTCIKYNFVNQNNEYLGGAISPGIPMRLKAMHHYTNRLPDIKPDYNYEKLTGQNTRESLLSGALLGAAAEVDECIRRYRETFENLVVVVTGGDSPYLCKQLKNRIFAHPDIVLSGLNNILNYNLEK
jgi:type III pantothenate kinase